MTQKSTKDDITFIEALAELLVKNDLGEIEVERNYAEDSSLAVRVSRKGSEQTVIAAAPALPQMAAPAPAPVAAAAPTQSATAPSTTPSDDPASHPGVVNSPMVGTVYLQPEPGSAAFVSVGQSISEGQTLLIVEAMKTMNQIPAPKSGTVLRILVNDGDAVEFGTPLMIVE